MQEKTEAIRAACIAANPSIMDLTFGCLVKQKYSVKEYVPVICEGTSISRTDDGEQEYVITTHGHTRDQVFIKRYYPSDNYIVEILGRPIRLADVLLAVRCKDENLEREFGEKYPGHPPVKYNGFYEFMKMLTAQGINDDFTFWNLLKDDLRDQSPETVDFLYSLLKS